MIAPQRIGKYQIIQRLGAGGMGEVYLARAPGPEGIDKLVAVKRILPHLAMTDDHVRQFLREARISVTLHHPNIVQVFEVGQAETGYFFAMEYVPGVHLGKLSGRASLADVVGVGIAVAAGLHHAHETVGIVHRDVSPSNVIVSTEGAIKLTDFGIAKALIDESNHTRTDELKGKVSYMSPEQCLGLPLDGRSDIFSLGVVLYELTTGTRLFEEKAKFVSMARIVSGDIPPPQERVPDYPPELAAIVMKALHKDPKERFQTAQAMQLELEAYAREQRLAVSAVSLAALVRGLAPPVVTRTTAESTASIEPAQTTTDTTTTAALPVAQPRKARHVLGALVAGASVAAGVLWWSASRATEPAIAEPLFPSVTPVAEPPPVRETPRPRPRPPPPPPKATAPIPRAVPLPKAPAPSASSAPPSPKKEPKKTPKKEPWNLDSMDPP